MKVITVFFEVIWSHIQNFFGYHKDDSVIPKNTPYCYELDEEKNASNPISGYWIKPCKYYRNLGKTGSACTYCGFMGWDPCLSDQCKICGINEYEIK